MKHWPLSLLGLAVCIASIAAADLTCSAADNPQVPAAKAEQGVKPAEPTKTDLSKVEIDEKRKTVSLSAVVADRPKPADDAKPAPLSCALVGKAGKVAESLFVTECTAEDLSAALLKVGAKAGKPADAETPPEGTAVNVFVVYTLEGQKPVRRPIDELVAYLGTARPMKVQPWIFTGSAQATDPTTNAKVLQARLTQSLIGLHWADASPLLQNPRKECLKQNLYRANTAEVPPAGTVVKIVLEPQVPNVPEGTRRVHVFLTGRVQGVGYRAWTVRQANELGLNGWVWNLDDGRVEALVEGPKDKVADLLKRMETGPTTAKVDKVDATDETPQGDFKGFTRRN